MGHPQWEWGQH